jgi:hypothetical protein
VEQYDMELVLRFIVFRKMAESSLTNVGDLGEFLTDQAKARAQDRAFDYRNEETAFRETFGLLAKTLGDDAFRRYDAEKARFVGGFSVSAFEAVAIGIGYNPVKATARRVQLSDRVKAMWTAAEFVDNSGSGIRASSRVPKIIPYGRRTFAK